MSTITSLHVGRAIDDVAAHGDNDILPFDIESRFLGEKRSELVEQVTALADQIARKTDEDLKGFFKQQTVPHERLLAPAGYTGFRTTTKIHPFWNLYLNAVGVAIAEAHEPTRSKRAHSYRYAPSGDRLFIPARSWRAYLEAVLVDVRALSRKSVVVQTDISSFYDHIYHHRLKNFLDDLIASDSNIPLQVEQLLPKIVGGRSFGLPVGGQGARALAEVFLASLDRSLAAAAVCSHRYVDDFVLLAENQADAYRALGVLARALADVGLSLNRTKTSMLSAYGFQQLLEARLGYSDQEARQLVEIDLHFDPYTSETPHEDYDALRETVLALDIERLLIVELEKGQADPFVVSQVARSLRVMTTERALGLVQALLDAKNLHSFRASWATIMRSVSHVRTDPNHESAYEEIDEALDDVSERAPHLLAVDTNCLHYLRALRTNSTERRQAVVLALYGKDSQTIRRACIDCWTNWGDRERFLALRNAWSSLSEPEQRMLWLGAPRFGDDGTHFMSQERKSVGANWTQPRFTKTYLSWVDNEVATS